MKDIILKPFYNAIVFAGKRIEKRRFTDPPVIIGGCGRSGTTLLLSVLSAHPKIFACSRELNIFGRAKEGKEGELILTRIYRLYRTFLQEKFKPDANRWCEKSPNNIRHIGRIDRYFDGKFRFIHIIRDGRDVVISQHPTKSDNSYYISPDRWTGDVNKGLAFSEHPCVLTVKYEELVNAFDRTIQVICNFINVEVTDEILNWYDHTSISRHDAIPGAISNITPDAIGRWRLPENRERLAEFMQNKEAVALLKKLSYVKD